MLELAVLGLLQDQELHGYELKKRLGEVLGPFAPVSFGSLYPALARLETAGAVRAVDAGGNAPAVPMTGSIGGEVAAFRARRATARGARNKKVYGLTNRGRALFAELLTASPAAADDDRSFGLRLAFASYLSPADRLGLFERRRAHLVERLARARASLRAGRERVDAYACSLIEHGAETTERDISWLDRLIAAERERCDAPAAPANDEAPAAPAND